MASELGEVPLAHSWGLGPASGLGRWAVPLPSHPPVKWGGAAGETTLGGRAV